MYTSDQSFLLYAFPVFFALIGLEAYLFRRMRQGSYAWRESVSSLGIAIGYKLSSAINPLVVGWIGLQLWDYRLATIPLNNWWAPIILFFGVEFAYYWLHRLSHECRWLWATHVVHHTPQHLNLSTAYRLGWTSLFSCGWLLFLPLIVIGFHPAAVFGMLATNILYQFLLHTILVPKLGPLEWILNTPSHHRVHHAVNPAYIDRNYGGIVIVFDRMFGTFAEESDDNPCRYGLVQQIATLNPLTLVFHEWIALARDVAHAPAWRDKLMFAFGPPGWRPDASAVVDSSTRLTHT